MAPSMAMSHSSSVPVIPTTALAPPPTRTLPPRPSTTAEGVVLARSTTQKEKYGHSFTGAPEGFNQACSFQKMNRDSNSSNGFFLGSPFSLTQAGPGSYPNLDRSTLIPPGPSKTRAATLARRLRDCRPLTGPAATLSLHGADRLLYEPGPESYDLAGGGCFGGALAKRNYLDSAFASEQGRFPPTRVLGSGLERTQGVHEPRK